MSLIYGCGTECDEAQGWCEKCDPKPESCEALLKDATSDVCAQLIATYEAACSE